jgi:peptidoglycan-associated lipoprotein
LGFTGLRIELGHTAPISRGEIIMLPRFNAVTGVSAAAAALLLVAACSSTPDPGAMGPGGPTGPGGPGGISSSRFGPGSQQDLASTAGDRVFFAYDRAEISSEAQQILHRQSDWLRRYGNVSVTIEGHCDERGTREYNLALGERRAQAVKNVLVALGVPASRVATISYGKERPEIPHSDDQSYAQNRRGVTTVN